MTHAALPLKLTVAGSSAECIRARLALSVLEWVTLETRKFLL